MIRIYFCNISTLSESDAAWDLVYPARRARRCPRAADKLRNLAAGLLLRHVLGVRRDADLAYTPHGKPYLAAGGPCFNLAHGGRAVALAVGQSSLGCDVEMPEPVPPPLAQRTLSPEEQERFARRGREFFWECWTRKESVLKALGVGLLLDPRRISVWPGPQVRVAEREFFVHSARIGDHVWSVAWEGAFQPLEIQTFDAASLTSF